MPRSWPVIKREFGELLRSRAYILGTLMGPILIVLLFAIPFLLRQSGGGGERELLILDATGTGIGREIADAFAGGASADGDTGVGTLFNARVEEVTGEANEARVEARERITAETGAPLDGYLYLPEGFIDGEEALYEGRNATSITQMEQMEGVIRSVVRGRRLALEGVPTEALARVMAPVRIENRKPGSEEQEGTRADVSLVLGYLMAFAVYLSVLLFADAVMRGVLEEKRDRIVEVLLSSIDARSFITGKVLGIGFASLLQIGVWVGFAAAALTWGPGIAARYFDVPEIVLPPIPGSVAVAFIFFFATGFLLYAALFGAAGAIATSDQEANQMRFPAQIPLLIAIFMAQAVLADADSTMAVIGTLIPFTAPVIVPFRAMLTEIPLAQYLIAGGLMIATVIGLMWAAAKIYHIGVLSTGKRPTLKELARWLRTA
ncbi:MAG: ABC transporter permease [Candidatus Longimicrobiales bacterium M2_2A_002]